MLVYSADAKGSSARAQQVGVTVADVPRSSTKSIDLEENLRRHEKWTQAMQH